MRLVCVTMDPSFEEVIGGYIERTQAGTALSMPADVAQLVARSIIEALRPVTDAGYQPVVIASPQVRAQVRTILAPHMPGAAVLGYNEIVSGVDVESMGLVSLPEEAGAGAA
jgi:flagellar biosynthesis protein FlhA